MKRQWGMVVAAVLVMAVAVCAVLEVGLRLVAPMGITGVGFATTEAGRRYGWGFAAHDTVMVRNPDSGEAYVDRVNSRGWRDREHDFAKPPGRFRVVLLGDSNVFGYAVRGEDTIGRFLEKRLAAAGLDAEVISLGLSAWGTDQELEALRLEGVKYAPDVVVIHFCDNDLRDITHMEIGGKFSQRRPFFYALDGEGRAVRHDNPGYRIPPAVWAKEIPLRYSQLARHLHAGYWVARQLSKTPYEVTPGQVRLLRLSYGDALPAAFLAELDRLVEKRVDKPQLEALIAAHGLRDRQDELLRLLERVNAQEGNPDAAFFQIGADPAIDPGWRLFRGLLREAKAVAEGAGAVLAVSTDDDEGRRQWMLDWRRISPAPEVRERFYTANRELERLTAELGVSYIPPLQPVHRNRNDVHPDAAGNDTIAGNMAAAILGMMGR